MPSFRATALRRGAVVAGQHDDGDAVGLERRERLRGVVLHRIGDGDDAGELAVDGDEDRGRAFAAKLARPPIQAAALRCSTRPETARCR